MRTIRTPTDYLLRCTRYINLNPMRARMTDGPAAFPWSSCACLCGLRDEALLTPHPVQRALGTEGYRAMRAEAIRLYLQQQRAYGRDDFRAWSKPRPSDTPA